MFYISTNTCPLVHVLLLLQYEVACEVGKPSVNYRETIARKAAFNYLHKKQSGGSGQYARVVGYIEPLEVSFYQ
jgi:translation elongation factor EF-G